MLEDLFFFMLGLALKFWICWGAGEPWEELVFFYVADVLCFTGLGGRGKNCFFFYVAVDVWEELVFFLCWAPWPSARPLNSPQHKKKPVLPKARFAARFFHEFTKNCFFLCWAGFRNVTAWVVVAPWDHEDISTQRQQSLPNSNMDNVLGAIGLLWTFSECPAGFRTVGPGQEFRVVPPILSYVPNVV